jgi:membrane protein
VPGRLWRHIADGRMSLIAAGCAFYATLALFPGLSMLVSLYGLVFDPVTVVPQLNLLRDVLPPEALVLISRQVHALVTQPSMDLQLNVLVTAGFTLWSASTGTKSILAAIGNTYGEASVSVLRFQVTGLAMTLCAVLAAVLTLAILVALPEALPLLDSTPTLRGVLHFTSLGMLVAFVWASIASLYHFAPPPGTTPTPLVIPGSLVAAALWLGASVLFSIYVGKVAQFDATYGPLAAVAGVMLWFWVSTYIVLLGAELNAALGGADISQPLLR